MTSHTGWSIASASQASSSNFSSTPSSGSANARPPPPKRRHKDSRERTLLRVPALPVVFGSQLVSVAEGNLVQQSHDQESISGMSNISFASSNNRAILQAQLELKTALLKEAKREAEDAQLKVQMVTTENMQVEESNDGLERDLSEMMRSDEAEQAKQAALQQLYQQTVTAAKEDAKAEARTVYSELQHEFCEEREIMIREVKAEAEESKAMQRFSLIAEEQHQTILQQELGEAQSMSADQLQRAVNECDTRHREIMMSEETHFRNQALLRVESTEQQMLQQQEHQRQIWEQQATAAAQRIRDEAEQRWREKEAQAIAMF